MFFLGGGGAKCPPRALSGPVLRGALGSVKLVMTPPWLLHGGGQLPRGPCEAS